MSAPPDVAHFRTHRVRGWRVWCLRCNRHAVVTFEAANSPETETVVGVSRRLKCSACGSKAVQVMPDWPPVGPGGREL